MLLRLIAIIEYVKIHSLEKNADTAQLETDFWMSLQEKNRNIYLFTCTSINHNLSVYAKKFNNVYLAYNLSAHIRPRESCEENAKNLCKYENDMSKYINIIRQRHANGPETSEQLEEALWDVSIRFYPVICSQLFEAARNVMIDTG